MLSLFFYHHWAYLQFKFDNACVPKETFILQGCVTYVPCIRALDHCPMALARSGGYGGQASPSQSTCFLLPLSHWKTVIPLGLFLFSVVSASQPASCCSWSCPFSFHTSFIVGLPGSMVATVIHSFGILSSSIYVTWNLLSFITFSDVHIIISFFKNFRSSELASDIRLNAEDVHLNKTWRFSQKFCNHVPIFLQFISQHIIPSLRPK